MCASQRVDFGERSHDIFRTNKKDSTSHLGGNPTCEQRSDCATKVCQRDMQSGSPPACPPGPSVARDGQSKESTGFVWNSAGIVCTRLAKTDVWRRGSQCWSCKQCGDSSDGTCFLCFEPSQVFVSRQGAVRRSVVAPRVGLHSEQSDVGSCSGGVERFCVGEPWLLRLLVQSCDPRSGQVIHGESGISVSWKARVLLARRARSDTRGAPSVGVGASTHGWGGTRSVACNMSKSLGHRQPEEPIIIASANGLKLACCTKKRTVEKSTNSELSHLRMLPYTSQARRWRSEAAYDATRVCHLIRATEVQHTRQDNTIQYDTVLYTTQYTIQYTVQYTIRKTMQYTVQYKIQYTIFNTKYNTKYNTIYNTIRYNKICTACTALHCNDTTPHHTTPHHTTPHHTTPHHTTPHHTTLHYTTLQYTTLPYMTLQSANIDEHLVAFHRPRCQ